MRLRAALSSPLFVSVMVLCAACGGASKPAPAPAEPEGPMASMVEAAVVVSQCPDQGRMNSRLAQSAIRKLVEPCAGVPGGKAHFSAKLLPGGDIELASPEGDAAEGVVPTCVLKNRLRHKVLLKKACVFDVKLEERTVSVTSGSASAAP